MRHLLCLGGVGCNLNVMLSVSTTVTMLSVRTEVRLNECISTPLLLNRCLDPVLVTTLEVHVGGNFI